MAKVPFTALGPALSESVSPFAGSKNGEAGVEVTPVGRPDRLTLTDPLNPPTGISVSCIWAAVLGEIVCWDGLTLMENDGGTDP